MMKKTLLVPVLLLVINAAYFVHSRENHSQRVQTSAPQAIMITASGFSPNRIMYHQGETISLTVHNLDSKTHNFIIRDFFIFSRNLKPGEVTTIQFKAVKKGTFPVISDATGTPEPGYKGDLIIN